eukprot:3549266-Lingulodinium_polyedra.AAC.1
MERRLSIPPTGHMIFEEGEFTPGFAAYSTAHGCNCEYACGWLCSNSRRLQPLSTKASSWRFPSEFHS